MLEAYIEERSLSQLEERLPAELEQVKPALEQHIKNQPLNVHAALLMARCHQLDGEPGRAKQLYETVLHRDPENVEARIKLAKLFHDEGDTKTAVGQIRESLNMRPELVDNWILLSQYLKESGQEQDALNALKQHEMIKSFNDNLANAEKAFAGGEHVRADNMCRKLLELVPGEVRSLHLLAKIAGRFRHIEISTSLLANCIQTRPKNITMGLDYAWALLEGKHFGQVLEQCDRLMALAPQYIGIYKIRAEALYNLGRYEEAIEIFRALSALEEDHEASLVHLGKLLKTVGETGEAIDCFHQALRGDKALGLAYWELANLKTYRFTDDEITQMQDNLQSGDSSVMNKSLIEFALGKALEDRRLFEESFKHYQSANNAYKRLQSYRYTSQVNALKMFFNEAYFSSVGAGGSTSEAPVFVVGLPRSGSTLVEQILTSHSQVDATMELTGITSISRELNASTLPGKGQYPQALATLGAGQIQALAQKYLDSTHVYRSDAPYFVDKSPGNFHHIGLIKTLFPNAKIIDIRRNPMASGWSLYRHFFADSFMFSYDLVNIGRYYNDYIELMNHWHKVLPGQVMTLNYEDLVEDLPAKVNAILQHCGLPFEDACVDFHLNKRAVATPSSEQVRQPIFTDALEHWKNFEAHLAPLKGVIKSDPFTG